jgi:hypothetical protein
MKIITELNCSNCKFKTDKFEEIESDELNEQGGIKDSEDETKARKVKLITLPGKMKVTKKYWCGNPEVEQWITQHMWCRKWDATGTIHIKK